MFPVELLNLFFITRQPRDEAEEKVPKYDKSVYKRGDLLAVHRILFTHFGIYLGDNRVAHLIPDILPAVSKNQDAIKRAVTNSRLILGVVAKVASVRVDSLEDFAYGAPIIVNLLDKACSCPPFSSEEVARRAEKLLGSITYSLLWHNCEHYAMYCRYGTLASFQTNQFCETFRKTLFSSRSALLVALLGLGTLLYLGSVSPITTLPTLLLPFTLWMAS
ncbi:lecithin retinol acyltransferase b, tandem duplicate 2 [Megalops cyprinoides]|uniref:lecithin retinol acyltransferase b, tandem duplicate 2 n=1 Tax=Megalops cyprinoides TaxID=118141 RepID=UPI0018642437|nr:lecithin retinol acyltransferase b, tandem duplicate 2 [Megalops cyprinoides]